MKTFFSLVNFVIGILALLIGFGNLLFLSNNPTGAAAGAAATVVGVAFLWVATAAMFNRSE
ncbi:MAG: hypothetical protein CO105_00380 [Comamonadaceae bacterium CG_4_9_14_3_um_filter_60_33]|nr:MAG: hypothetical protein COZ09_06820 [Comamonadaceae bacterium CG_4_10_14_3_um_filter_60_42]PJB46881.1 MAG: hypothetical protein CO105_00380 [Comamonadaceae bacterium CG_4_9_14_3_um_filter_60_33]